MVAPYRFHCHYADGSPVPEAELDLIMRGFGFDSARDAERQFRAADRRRRFYDRQLARAS